MNKLQKQMEDLFTEIHKALLQEKYEECNELLEGLQIGKLPTITLIGALRAAFPVREKLPAWEPLLREIEKVTSNKRWLRGLL